MFLFDDVDTFFNEGNVDMEKRDESRRVAAISQEELAELQSLGIDAKRKNVLNNKEELEELVSTIKQSMYQDYKLAYSKNGEKHEDEATATVNI